MLSPPLIPGPWKQCDSLPEGWHLEWLLSSLQGDAGPVHTAHTAQQPPEAAVRRRLWHRFVSSGSRGMQCGREWEAEEQESRKRMGMRGRKEGKRSLKSYGPVCLSERLLREALQGNAFRKHEALRGQASL